MKKYAIKIYLIIMLFIMLFSASSVFAAYTGYIDYDSIYNPKNYESEFSEKNFIAVMQPVEWCGTVEAYIERGVFDDIDYKSIDIITKCTEPDDEQLGDVLVIELNNGSKEKVLESIEILKNNEYVIYSMPNYLVTPDDSKNEADKEPEYYLTDGVFSISIDGEGTEIIALYKNDRLTDTVIGSEISVMDKDFDTLAVYYWSGTDTMRPLNEKIVLSSEQVLSAQPKTVSEPQYGDIPAVYLTGDVSEMSKETRVTLEMSYKSETETINGYVSAKWQGNYSLNFDKKNYSIKLFEDAECNEKLKTRFKDWDKSNNYVLKANWIDSTAARNLVSAQLYETLPNSSLPGGTTGMMDGFPIRLYLNGEYRGLYTWNKPKKGWVFGMSGDNENELLYFSNLATGSGLFERKFSSDDSWELVYPDEHTGNEEFDRVTGFVAECSDEDFKNHIGEYIDMDSLLNYYVFSQVIMNHDGTGKNMNMATYDGKLWYIRPYDLDATFGIEWYGWATKPYDFDMSKENFCKSVLWRKLEDNLPQEIYDRYVLLRNNQLSEENILSAFRKFMDGIGDDLYAEDLSIWSNQPSRNYRYTQVEDFVKARYVYLDKYMEKFNVNGQ